MPRATRASAKAATSNASKKPYSKSPETNTKSTAESPSESTKARTGKDSHLYTDDNPATTLKGTGFKDAAAAHRTIELVSKRSLLYQFQTINTMYYRAKGHPHSDKSSNMQGAMKIFRKWLDETYPGAKEEQINFPLLRKEVVELYLPEIRRRAADLDIEVGWTEKYVALPKGKRLANVLMDETNPAERDLARVRQEALEHVLEERSGQMLEKHDSELWDERLKDPSTLHLKCIAYAYSPVKPEVLKGRAKPGGG